MKRRRNPHQNKKKGIDDEGNKKKKYAKKLNENLMKEDNPTTKALAVNSTTKKRVLQSKKGSDEKENIDDKDLKMCKGKLMLEKVNIIQSGRGVVKKKVNNTVHELFVKLLKYATNHTDIGPII